ncbi:MAG: alpha-ketoacid dehydrogenase subunit beta [Candidatus Thermoplasmatota archaeon]|jgi:pyruvate/2-oxoglutarate/acetoin dehydrogenase E1 component|nr:alpha-ketoacid dehydrogenase subunit beta [Candidatus Thermoplasmatota archaeon]
MSQINLVQSLNRSIDQLMAQDERIVVMGEDVGRDGGVFRVTDNLLNKYGDERVIDTPLNELAIIGMATGMAMYGLKPIAEIQFQDYIFPAFDQIVNNVAKMRYRTGGRFTVPLVIRTPYGGGVKGGLYHSQSGESYFVHTAGLTVVTPSNPYDARGLLVSAYKKNDPVIFLEPKRLYRAVKTEVPDELFEVEIGKAARLKEGDDVSIITYGSMVPTVMNAVEKNGVNAEVTDLRTLLPMDVSAIIQTAKKTGRVVIVHEAPKTLGVGAEISALIAERAIDSLLAPIVRVTGYDTPFPYSHEELYLPDEKRIMSAVNRVLAY